MFETTNHHHHTHNTTTNIKEHRAPTDESVRLLYDMEKAAHDKIIDSIRLDNTVIDCVIHAMNDFAGYQRKFAAVFKINGKRYTAIYEVGNDITDREIISNGIRDSIAKEIANHIIIDGLSKFKYDF